MDMGVVSDGIRATKVASERLRQALRASSEELVADALQELDASLRALQVTAEQLSQRQDGTEQRLAEAEESRLRTERQICTLQNDRDRLRAMLGNTQAQLAYLDPNLSFIDVNPAYARGSGYAREQLIGRNHFELFPDAENQAIFERAAATGEPVAFQAKPFTYPQRPELGITYWDWTLLPDKDAGGQVQGLVLSLVDVTERERARRRGRAHLAQLEKLMKVAQQVLGETTVQGVLHVVVDAARELTLARLSTSGHGYQDGVFRLCASSHAEGVAPCPLGEVIKMQRGGVFMDVIERKTPICLSEEQLRRQPGWWGLPDGHAPLRGLLAAPFMGRDGHARGLIMVSDKEQGEFTAEDETLLSQLAALASLGLQHIEAREEAQRRAAELDAIVAAMPDGVVMYDAEGNIVQANGVALKILGFSQDDVGLPLPERLQRIRPTGPTGEPLATDQLPLMRALRGETVRDATLSFQHDSMRSPSWLHISAAPIRSEDGKLISVVASLSDITPLRDALRGLEQANDKLQRQREELLGSYEDLRRLNDELQAERSRLKTVVDNAPLGIVLADDEGRILMANPAAERLYARTIPYREPFESHAQLMLCRPDGTPYDPRDLPLTRSALDGETCAGVDLAVQWPDGQRRRLRADSAPFCDSQGRVLGAVGILTDVTERRQAAETVSRYTQRLQILHRADQAILAGRSAHEVARSTLPYIQQLVPCERIGVSLFDFAAGQVSLLAVAASDKTEMETGWTGPLSDTAWPEELAQGKVRVVEDLLSLASLSPFEKTLQAEGIRSFTNVPLIAEGRLIGALNLGMSRPGQLTAEQMEIMREMADELAVGIQQARLRREIERHAHELERRVATRTAQLQASQARLQAVFDGAPIGIALLDRRGQILESNASLENLVGYPADELRGVTLARLVHPDDDNSSLASFEDWAEATRSSYGQVVRLLCQDDRLVWVNLNVALVGAGPQESGRAIAMIEDVTEARHAQERLIQAEKLAITGRLAASLAHEINNPLQSVIGCLSLVEEAQAEGGDITRYLHVAREELRRAAGIISSLRDVHSPSRPEDRRSTDLNALVERVLTLTQKRSEDNQVEVAWKPAKELPLLTLVPGRMQQVFLNLVLNAVEAMPQGGLLRVSTARTRRPAGVRTTITDSGGGIPPQVLTHLFEPFQTSKPDGLGLGLFISQRIVEEHGGRINVESRMGEGSTFSVWLPK